MNKLRATLLCGIAPAYVVTLCVSGCMKPPPSTAPATAAPAEPTASDTSQAEPAPVSAAYPNSPTKPPPVPVPNGQGLSYQLQKYIVVDQFGYRPDMAKVAILVDPQVGWNESDSYEPGPELEVRRWSDAEVVFKGKPSPYNGGSVDETSGDKGQWFDFTQLTEPGLYYVFDKARNVRSHPFEVGADVYKKVLKTAQRMFYFNRSNFAKEPPYSCVGERCWSLAADNLGPGQDKEARSVSDKDNEKTARDLSGGWWDAGDTNKYVTFANDAVHQMLTAYRERPSVFTDDFGIPESNNGRADLIDELLYEFDWLKKMQPNDLGGGVILKMGNIEYGDPVPDQSNFKRYYYPKPCSSAAIVAAGLYAHGALVFGTFAKLKGYAADLKQRALRAWEFYHANEKSDACDDGTIKSGDADRSLKEQEQIAVASAAYLFALTRDDKFNKYVKQHYQITRPFVDDRWSVYDQSQGDALMLFREVAGADAETVEAIASRRRTQLKDVEIYGFRPELDLYRAYMRPDSYHWGSNNARASFGNTNYDFVQYKLADEAEKPELIKRAAGILHSFHGVNPMQLVYLTNMYADGGDACADEAYHTWFRDKDPKWDNAREGLGPAPGYVTGGPNQHYCKDQDPKEHACAKSPVRQQPPEKAYIDSNTSWEPGNPFDKTWELTEPAIYYQASYLRLVSKFVD